MTSFFARVWPAVAVLVFSAESFGGAQVDLKSLIDELRPSIVSITTYDEKKNVVARGTGFFTSKEGEILTRLSLVEGAYRTEVKTDDEKVYPVAITSGKDTKTGLARIVIAIPRERVKPLVYKAKVPQVNEHVFVLGGGGREHEFVEGTVAAIEDSSLGKVIRINASLVPQLDGGPVFNTNGELVGVAVFSKPGDASSIANSGESLTGIIPTVSGTPAAFAATAVDKKPKQLNNPQPSYTTQARRNGVEGEVTLRILIGKDGKVLRANVVRGLPDGLDDQALKAVFKLKFKPAMKDGIPVQYMMSVIVEFRLREK